LDPLYLDATSTTRVARNRPKNTAINVAYSVSAVVSLVVLVEVTVALAVTVTGAGIDVTSLVSVKNR
jgi:hypothetical protein